MRFRLLGAVEADHEGSLVDLGHARQRTVLAALLVDANRVVSADQLMDRVWGDHPPQRGRDVLYGYLSRLRRALASTGVGIARRHGGYVITADDTVVDLHRFRRLVTQAYAADADERALQLFTEALDLWHGEAFAGLDTPWLTTVRAALNQERLVAQLEHADMALRRGKHAELLADLSTRAAQHPLDERLAGQLMLALYRGGRQAESLAHYERTRRRLADEVGTDPGPPLRTLHRRILSADPGLTASYTEPATTGSKPVPTPRQLPAAPSPFTGRTRELVNLDGALLDEQGAENVVVISAIGGSAGIGKTWLALHWAHENAARFPDGQLYVNLRGFGPGNRRLPPEGAVRGFLDALAPDPASIPVDPEAQAALYRSLVAGRRMLIVLDNAADTAQVAPLLPGGSHCAVLVTSRRRLTGLVTRHGASALTLDVLGRGEARQLLTRHLGTQATTAEPRAVGELLDHCAGLPLALGIVATRAAMRPGFPLAMLADELRQDSTRLDALDAGELGANLRAVFSWSYGALTPPAARLFRLLGLHPGPDIARAAVASLAGLPTDQINAPIAELVGAHLVTEHLPGRFTVHDLVRVYAREQAAALDSEVERHRALSRALEHYLHTAYSASQLTYRQHEIRFAAPSNGVTPEQLRTPQQATAWFTAEYEVLIAAVRAASEAGLGMQTWQLAWTLATFFDRHGHWREGVAMHNIALDAAQRAGDLAGQAHSHFSLHRLWVRLDRLDRARAHLDEALALFTQLGDRVGQARIQHGIAWVLGIEGRPRNALAHALQALDLYQASDHRIGIAHAHNAIGWYQSQLGDHHEAIGHCRRALDLLRELGYRHGQAMTMDSIGYIHYQLGEHARAVACYRNAVQVFRELGDRYERSVVLQHIADVHVATGNGRAARGAWRESLKILDQLGHPDADGVRTKLRTA